MQQKKLGDILYVFEVTPYQITQDTDAEIIKVQQEVVAGFKELNASLADKIVAYNYHAMVAQVPVWAPYVDDVSPELAWSSNSATVTIGADDNVFPTLTNPHSVTVTYSSSDTEKATIDGSTGSITLLAEGDTTISAVFAGNDTYEAQTVTYSLTVQSVGEHITYRYWEDPQLGYIRFLSESTPPSIVDIDANYYSNYTVKVGSTDYTFDPTNIDQDGYIWDDPTDKNVAIKNNADVKWPDVYVADALAGTDPDWVSVTAVYVAPAVLADPELAWSANSATVTLGEHNVFPTLINPNEITSGITYESSNDTVAEINNYGEIILVQNGETTISAIFEGDETYSASTVSYDLTVEGGSGESGQSGQSGESGESGQSGQE